ncbi:MAG TPA: lysophospholipid acyltransferase family protein [Solirubrobacter sp.]|nr:lysophospholipid acyltransferase family protein [Solirubrobacter sp.]
MDETRAETVRRRLRTIPPLVLGLVLVTALLPALLVVGLLTDAVRRVTFGVPPTAARLVVCLWVYLAAEVVGLAALAAVWILSLAGRRGAWLREVTWRLQQLWAGLLLGTVRVLFRLRLEVAGDDVISPGPVIVLMRHASIVDTLLPANLVAGPHGIRLRYVLKRELLADPCLDVAGRRLPNYFVRRGTGEAQEVERVRELAHGLGRGDGVLIYPEGTRFTPERRARAIARIAERDPRLAGRGDRLRYLLPPRLGGVGALLDGAPDADVVVVAHHGFDGLRLISDIWRGGLVGLVVRVRVTRVPRSTVPEAGAARADWLYDLWQDVDDWLKQRFAGAPTRAAA